MSSMHERELHHVLAKHPELLEPGLKFVESEVKVNRGLFCDLLFTDSANRRVYVEVKWIAGRRAVIQIEQYEAMSADNKDNARFVLAALEAKSGIPELLARRGFEYMQINAAELRKVVPPDWDFPVTLTRQVPSALNGPKSSSSQETRLLNVLLNNLQDELPNLQFVRHKEGPRLIMSWVGQDSFLFDFSSKVSDGIRCGFVVDLNIPDSERRSEFQSLLLRSSEAVENILGAVIANGVSEDRLIESGYSHWAKVTNHRRMGVCCFYRAPGIDMTDETAVTEAFAPKILQFIDRVDSLLNRYLPQPIQD